MKVELIWRKMVKREIIRRRKNYKQIERDKERKKHKDFKMLRKFIAREFLSQMMAIRFWHLENLRLNFDYRGHIPMY